MHLGFFLWYCSTHQPVLTNLSVSFLATLFLPTTTTANTFSLADVQGKLVSWQLHQSVEDTEQLWP